jgi:hypothetical protein
VPNWTSNTIITDNPALAGLLKDVWTTPGRRLLGRTVPMPRALELITVGSRMIEGRVVHQWYALDGGTRAEALSPQEEEMLADFYGTASWLDWARTNWGTKWDVTLGRIEDDLPDGTVQVWFDSAWSPPEPWLAKTVAIFPEGRTVLAYAEGGSGFWGLVAYQDGELVEQFTFETFWAGPAEVDEECRAHLDKYGLHEGG